MHAVRHAPDLSLDGTWRFQLLADPEAPLDDGRLARHRGARAVDPPGHLGPAPLHERPDALPGARRRRSRARTRPASTSARSSCPRPWPAAASSSTSGRPRASCWSRVNGVDVGVSKDSHLAAEFDVTEHLRPAPERPAPDRREVVRRDVHRGPGPVVARRDQPLGLPVRDRAGLHRRPRRDGRPGRRPDDRHARPDRRPRVRGRRRAAGRLHRRGRDPGLAGAGDGRDRAARRAGRGRSPTITRRHVVGGPAAVADDPEAWERGAPRRDPAAHRAGLVRARRSRASRRGPPSARASTTSSVTVRDPDGAVVETRDGPDRLPAGRDPRPRPARQRRARVHPRGQPPRLRPAHRAGRLARVDARRPRPDAAASGSTPCAPRTTRTTRPSWT